MGEVVALTVVLPIILNEGYHAYFRLLRRRKKLREEGRESEILLSYHTMEKIRENSPFRRKVEDETKDDSIHEENLELPSLYNQEVSQEESDLYDEVISKKQKKKRVSFSSLMNPQHIAEFLKRKVTPSKILEVAESGLDLVNAGLNGDWLKFVQFLISFIFRETKYLTDHPEDVEYLKHEEFSKKLINALQTTSKPKIKRNKA